MNACPNCGRENAADAKFCSDCGTRLAAERTGAREERKIVSVVFADLVGFTARSEKPDPEDVQAIQTPSFQRVRAAYREALTCLPEDERERRREITRRIVVAL